MTLSYLTKLRVPTVASLRSFRYRTRDVECFYQSHAGGVVRSGNDGGVIPCLESGGNRGLTSVRWGKSFRPKFGCDNRIILPVIVLGDGVAIRVEKLEKRIY